MWLCGAAAIDDGAKVGVGEAEVFAEEGAGDLAEAGFATQPRFLDGQSFGGLSGRIQQRPVAAVEDFGLPVRRPRHGRVGTRGRHDGCSLEMAVPERQENGEQPSGSSSSALAFPRVASRSTASRGRNERWM